MLGDNAIITLKQIAYSEVSTPKDRVAAVSALFKNNADSTENCVIVLDNIIANEAVKDKDRVNASALLLAIKKQVGDAEQPEQADETAVSQELYNQYVRAK